MGSRAVLLAVCLTIRAVSLCSGQDSSVFVVPERTPEPAFTLLDINGRTVSSKDFVGKVAVVSFGATWCASCVSELKSLERLQARFPKDLLVYFVALDGRGDKDVKPFIDKHGFRVATLIDPRMAVAREHGVRWVPVTIVVDRKGVMVARAVGPREWDGKQALDLVQSLMKR
ncbi:MAG TPA: TlpA disulfide reductase family protein [Thermoanaerobaculia bacterium]|jgi:peroxiredoxin